MSICDFLDVSQLFAIGLGFDIAGGYLLWVFGVDDLMYGSAPNLETGEERKARQADAEAAES